LELLKRFRAAEIEFAFPARTMFLADDPRRGLNVQLANAAAGNGHGHAGRRRAPPAPLMRPLGRPSAARFFTPLARATPSPRSPYKRRARATCFRHAL
jgi:hypothetical protein